MYTSSEQYQHPCGLPGIFSFVRTGQLNKMWSLAYVQLFCFDVCI